MMTIDPRLADRRREVAEERARKNVTRLLRLIVFLAVLGGLVWLFLSPTLSVTSVDVSGVQSSDTFEILEEQKVVAGRPLILIRSSSVEQALLGDLWVETASVELDWPQRVAVTIQERVAVAWVETSEGWAGRSVDGVALPGLDEPDSTLAHISLPLIEDADAIDSLTVLGALEFVANLPVSLSSNALVEEREGELWAVVSGFTVRLGRPTEMAEKALSLATLLEQEIPEDSVINVIAPTNPAVTPPTPPGEEQQEGETEEEPQP